MLVESKVLKTHKNNKKLFNISIRNSTHNYISLALSVTYFVPPALLVCAGQSKCDISFWNSYSPNVAAKTLALLWPFHFHPASFPAFTNPAPLLSFACPSCFSKLDFNSYFAVRKLCKHLEQSLFENTFLYIICDAYAQCSAISHTLHRWRGDGVGFPKVDGHFAICVRLKIFC